jgi:release factor glutamine methyltransferase
MKSILEILKEAKEILQKKGLNDPQRSAEELLAHVLGFNRMDLYLHYDFPLEEKEIQSFRHLLARREKREPIQYLCGKLPFYHAEIEVSSDVLIPRPETELLVDKVVQTLKEEKGSEKLLLDLCTGSGCIGIAIKKSLPELTVVLADISSQALEVAKRNAKKNFVEVLFHQGDLMEGFPKKIDYLVCNPPYVAAEEFSQLQEEVRNFEPSLALVAGHGGYEFYERLSKTLPPFLNKGAKLFFEIGATQKEGIQKIFCQDGWPRGQFFCDWNGKDRFFFLENE